MNISMSIPKTTMNESKGYQRLRTEDDDFPPLASNLGPTQISISRQHLSSHVLVYALLVVSNIVFLSLWLKPQGESDCIRPLLISCTLLYHHFLLV